MNGTVRDGFVLLLLVMGLLVLLAFLLFLMPAIHSQGGLLIGSACGSGKGMLVMDARYLIGLVLINGKECV